MLLLGHGGAINTAHVVIVANARSTPIKRLLKTVSPERVFDLTYGQPRKTVILFDNGTLALVHRTLAEVVRALGISLQPDQDRSG